MVNKMLTTVFYIVKITWILLLIFENGSTGFQINEYSKKHIDSATRAADTKYDTDNTMDQPEIKYDVFPTMNNTWINDPKPYCALPYVYLIRFVSSMLQYLGIISLLVPM